MSFSPDSPISELGYTTKQVAKLLNLHYKTVENMRKLGGGPPFTDLNGRVYYPCHEFSAWMQVKFGEIRLSRAL